VKEKWCLDDPNPYTQIILDYFWSPPGWAEQHWTENFFSSSLHNLASILAPNGCVYLPFQEHTFNMCVKHIHKIRENYSVTFLKKSELNEIALWRYTQDIDEDVMQNVYGKKIGQEEEYCILKNSNKISDDSYTQAVLSWLDDVPNTRYIKLRLLSAPEHKLIRSLRNIRPFPKTYKGSNILIPYDGFLVLAEAEERSKDTKQIKESAKVIIVSSQSKKGQGPRRPPLQPYYIAYAYCDSYAITYAIAYCDSYAITYAITSSIPTPPPRNRSRQLRESLVLTTSTSSRPRKCPPPILTRSICFLWGFDSDDASLRNRLLRDVPGATIVFSKKVDANGCLYFVYSVRELSGIPDQQLEEVHQTITILAASLCRMMNARASEFRNTSVHETAQVAARLLKDAVSGILKGDEYEVELLVVEDFFKQIPTFNQVKKLNHFLGVIEHKGIEVEIVEMAVHEVTRLPRARVTLKSTYKELTTKTVHEIFDTSEEWNNGYSNTAGSVQSITIKDKTGGSAFASSFVVDIFSNKKTDNTMTCAGFTTQQKGNSDSAALRKAVSVHKRVALRNEIEEAIAKGLHEANEDKLKAVEEAVEEAVRLEAGKWQKTLRETEDRIAAERDAAATKKRQKLIEAVKGEMEALKVQLEEHAAREIEEAIAKGLHEANEDKLKAVEEAVEEAVRLEVGKWQKTLRETEDRIAAERDAAAKKKRQKLIEAVKGEMKALKVQLEEDNGQLEAAKGELEDANGQLEDANGKLEAAKGELEDANGQLEDANGKLEAANKKIQKLIEAAKKQVANLVQIVNRGKEKRKKQQSAAEEAEETMRERFGLMLAERDATAQKEISNLKKEAKEREAGLVEREGRVGLREAEVEGREGRVGLREAKVKGREGEVGKGEETLRKNRSVLESTRTNLAEREAGVVEREGRVGTREAEVEGREGRVGTREEEARVAAEEARIAAEEEAAAKADALRLEEEVRNAAEEEAAKAQKEISDLKNNLLAAEKAVAKMRETLEIEAAKAEKLRLEEEARVAAEEARIAAEEEAAKAEKLRLEEEARVAAEEEAAAKADALRLEEEVRNAAEEKAAGGEKIREIVKSTLEDVERVAKAMGEDLRVSSNKRGVPLPKTPSRVQNEDTSKKQRIVVGADASTIL
ncbi:hypothetical protein TrRE_jg627, partial [Triparma retinervis]